MVHAQSAKWVNVTPPGAIVDNASYTTAEIDTAGFDYLEVIVALGATDIAMAALSLTESDTSGSGHAAISGATFASALPSDTDDNGLFAFMLPLQGRKRYIDVTATAGNGTLGTYACILARLSRAEQAPDTATERGLTGQVIL